MKRPSTVDGILNLEVPARVIEKRVPKALTRNTVLPRRFISSDLSPHHPSFHSEGEEEEMKEKMTERGKPKRYNMGGKKRQALLGRG